MMKLRGDDVHDGDVHDDDVRGGDVRGGNDGTTPTRGRARTDAAPATADAAPTASRPDRTAPAAPGLDDLRIRPYGVNDADALRGMSQRLSRQSLYQRFSSGTPTIPELYVRHLQRMDHWDHDALVALHDDEITGIAEYVRERSEPRHADLAVLITDPWQRNGLGSLLVALLIPMAARRGINGFGVDVMPDNTGAHRAVRSRWPEVRPYRSSGFAHYDLPLSPLNPPPNPPLGPPPLPATLSGQVWPPPMEPGDGRPRVPATLR